MTVRRVQKEALIGASVIFDQNDVENKKINSNLINNFVDIISLNALSGDSVVPTTGTYEIHVLTNEGSGYKSISDNGSLDATKTGGNASADGVVEGASFSGLPIAIKIVPTSVNVAVAYKVDITQSNIK